MKILSKLLIVRSTYNIGDHNCLRYLFESNDDLVTTIIVDEKILNKNVSWRNKTVKHDYAIKLDRQLAKYDSFFKNLHFAQNDNQLKFKLTKAIKVINDSMVWSKERVKNYHTKTKIPKQKYGIQCKNWWCKTLQEYMVLVRNTYNDWKLNDWSGPKQPYIDAKRLFKCRKCYNIKLLRDKKLRKIDELFKYDHIAFWKKIKLAQRKNIQVDMTIDELTKEYTTLFNEPFDASIDLEMVHTELHQLLEKEAEPVCISHETILSIIKELPNGKSVGYHGISNEMVKYALSENSFRIVDYYEIIFNKILETSVIPFDFNISIIKPLVKDRNKPTNVLTNIRPVATSDVTPSIFEKTLVSQIRKSSPTNPKQFGFKKDHRALMQYLL